MKYQQKKCILNCILTVVARAELNQRRRYDRVGNENYGVVNFVDLERGV